MTEELKQKAENYSNRLYIEPITRHDIRQAYIAGATENGIKWHDLRKDPNDLPPKENDVYSKEVRVCLGAGRYMQSMFSYALKEDGSEHCWVCCDPIAWCESPQFQE